MKTLTIDEATTLVPAIGAREPNGNVSKQYQFVSTREILEQVHEKGWLITNASAQGRNMYAQHRVTLVHEDSINEMANGNQDGVLRIELFNSHNRTKRLTFAIGYFRFVCSNGLIVASGPAETIRAKHSIGNSPNHCLNDNLIERIEQLTTKFPTVAQKIKDLQSRLLTDEEQINFAAYAIKGRYSYRPQLPKRFSNMEESAAKILGVRRPADEGNSAWCVFNRVQENVINGVPNFTQPIRSYSDNIRVNTLLWKGVDATLEVANEGLKSTLQSFLAKQR